MPRGPWGFPVTEGLDSMLRDRVHFSLDLSPEWSGFFSQSHTACLTSLNGNSVG